MALPIKQLIEDNSNDRQYFAMIPAMMWPDIRLVSSLEVDIIADHVKELGEDLDVYAKWLYTTLKKICGENGGQCFLSTKGLAKFAGMSEGKVSESKAKLVRAGLITIISKKRSAKGQALDHIRVLDIWERNLKIVKIRQKRSPHEHISESVHHMNANPEKRSPHERKRSPHETEEEPLKKNHVEEEPFAPTAQKSTPPVSEKELQDDGARAIDDSSGSHVPDSSIASAMGDAQECDEAAQVTESVSGAEEVGRSPDIFDLALNTEKAREEMGNYAVPPEAGGKDSWAGGPVDAFCILAGIPPQMLSEVKRESWGRKFKQIADEWPHVNVTPELMVKAIEAVPEDANVGWRSFADPYVGNFDKYIGPLLARGGQPVSVNKSTGRPEDSDAWLRP